MTRFHSRSPSTMIRLGITVASVLLIYYHFFRSSNMSDSEVSDIISYVRSNNENVQGRSFPKGFGWGTATASYQVEGAWNTDGRGPCIWDDFTHSQPSPIADKSTGDDACKSYEHYKQDVQLIKNIGSTHYRFSISWSRILPTGKINEVNEKGINYYNNLIDELLENGVQPLVTLYHWDLPSRLQDEGGWVNEKIVDWFTDYADLCFKRFGDRVKHWITFNEPWVFIIMGNSTHAPSYKDDKQYIRGHHVIKAHVKSWHLYQNVYKKSQKGRVGITLNTSMFLPASDKPEDIEAAQRAFDFEIGWFADPIISTGYYPKRMRDKIEEKCKGKSCYLPIFTDKEAKENKGSCDFLGVNHYTSVNVSFGISGMEDTVKTQDPSLPKSGSSWLRPYPEGFRLLLNWIRKRYGNPPVFITENGTSDRSGTLNDVDRVKYFKDYLSELLKSILLDKCNVEGYLAWSLLDNFEWAEGYIEKFGIHNVNFDDPNRTRTAKLSSKYLSDIFKTNRLVPE